MRKIIGIGETIMDIIFRNGHPDAAVPGGSVFNSLISLGRLGMSASFISETGNDRAGRVILDFLKDNGVDNSNVCVYADGKTPISLAWLNQDNDAEYDFYKDYPKARLDVAWPEIGKDDIVMMASYFVLNPVLRNKTTEFLEYARRRGALIYYDFNFRKSHAAEATALYADILSNIDYADIVRGSTEDMENMFLPNIHQTDAGGIYDTEVRHHCSTMICTDGPREVSLLTPGLRKSYGIGKIGTVSTIGAGDNFNAGVVFGLLREGVLRDDIDSMTESQWDAVIRCGIDFSAEVCQSLDNYISKDFAMNYRKE
ncbi:MAG: carbohydrate kinase [Bacteroidaceae bacterium]|nr:carbohydrate kinase [Bacteroidaceae bacterium]